MGNLQIISFIVVICSVWSVFGDHFELPLTKIRVPPNVLSKLKRTEVDLEGSYATSGTYYTTITLGTPSKPFNVIVDTGSSDLIVYSTPCSGCDPLLNSYNPTSSSTSQSISCTAPGYNTQNNIYCDTCDSRRCGTLNQYGDGSSFSGHLYSDMFQISNISQARVTFSAISQISNNGDFGGVIDGLWGMAYFRLGFATPVYDNLVSQSAIVNSFSMCLNDTSPRMYLGVDYSQVEGFKWTPIVYDAWYQVELDGVSVDGTKLSATASDLNNTIMDSGTTLIALKDNIFNGFLAKLDAMCAAGINLVHYCNVAQSQNVITGSNCYSMTDAQVNAYPTISFEFPGAGSYDVPPQLYFVSTENNNRCGGLAAAGSLNTNILGDVFMQGYNIVFDRANNKLGFGASSTCGVKGNETPSTTTTTSNSMRNEPFFVLLALFFYLVL